MTNQTVNKKEDSTQKKEDINKDKVLPPDPETLDTTDPQDNMKGPISSAVQKVKEATEEGDKQSKEEADKKKDENT